MNKGVLFFVLIAMLGAVLYVKSISFNDHSAQIALAKETHQAMSAMMEDFREARFSTIVGVPADGTWYHAVAFNRGEHGVVRYAINPANHELKRTEGNVEHGIARCMTGLNVRRQPGVLDVLEVQLEARNQSVLVSNFKIRTRD